MNPALKEVRAQGHRRLGKALVVAQLAISMVLVVGATLFVGTLVKLYAVDRGFDSDGVLVVNVRSSRPYPAARAKAGAGRAARAAEDRAGRSIGERRSASCRSAGVSGSHDVQSKATRLERTNPKRSAST